MTIQAGVTHDVVIYPGVSGVAAIGLIVAGATYRVSPAADFLPRFSMGGPRSEDLSAYASYVQTDWRGMHGLEVAQDDRGYYEVVGMRPDRENGGLVVIPGPRLATTGANAVSWSSMYIGPYSYARVLLLKGVHCTVELDPANGFDSTDVILAASRVFRPIRIGADSPPIYSVEAEAYLPGFIFSAVQYSTIMFISTYYVSNRTGYQRPDVTWSPLHAGWGVNLYQPIGSTTAGALGVYDGRLWRAEPEGSRVAVYRPTQTTYGYWSDWTDTAPGNRIMHMTEFIGRLFIGCTDSLWAYEAGRTYKVLDFHDQEDGANFTLMQTAQGSLWFNIRSQLYRYTSGGLLELMRLDLEDYIPNSICEIPGALLISAGKISGQKVFRLDTDSGGVQEFVNLEEIDAGTSFPCSHCLPVVFSPSVWQVQDIDGPLRMPLPQTEVVMVGPMVTTVQAWDGSSKSAVFLYWDPPVLDAREVSESMSVGHLTTEFSDNQHYVITPYLDLGYPQVQKSWNRIRLRVSGSGYSFDIISVYYRQEGTTTWTLAQEVIGTALDNYGRVTVELPINLRSQLLQVKVAFSVREPGFGTTYPTPNLGTPVLRELIVDGLYLATGLTSPGVRKIHTFAAEVVDNLETLSGALENSCAYITASLFSIAQPGLVHTVALPYPGPTGTTVRAIVEIDQNGGYAPVLAYDNSAIGSMLSLRITEV